MERLRLIIEEVEKHIELLNYEEEKLKELLTKETPFKDYEGLVLADAFIFRFIKAQSAMGEKLFPHFFEFLTGKPYTEVAFIDILNTLEKYGFLKAEEWIRIRKLRNQFVHIYPWEMQERLDALKEALNALKILREVHGKVKEFLKRKEV